MKGNLNVASVIFMIFFPQFNLTFGNDIMFYQHYSEQNIISNNIKKEPTDEALIEITTKYA